MPAVITAAINLLGPDIVLGHAKELTASRRPVPAGAGMLPWDVIVDALDGAGFAGPLVIHGLDEPDVNLAVHALRDVMAPKQDA